MLTIPKNKTQKFLISDHPLQHGQRWTVALRGVVTRVPPVLFVLFRQMSRDFVGFVGGAGGGPRV